MCEDLHLMGKLTLFEKDRKAAVREDRIVNVAQYKNKKGHPEGWPKSY